MTDLTMNLFKVAATLACLGMAAPFAVLFAKQDGAAVEKADGSPQPNVSGMGKTAVAFWVASFLAATAGLVSWLWV